MIDKDKFTCKDEIDMYRLYGFTVLKAYSEKEFQILKRFAREWIYRLLADYTAGKQEQRPLEKYHIWSKIDFVDHAKIFVAKNRYLYSPPEIESVLFNSTVKDFLKELGIKQYKIWDDGWGWLGFRFIRPGVGDGYPLTRKDWGLAQGVVSCWLPIIGFSEKETLNLVAGSHLKEYEKYLPNNGKFNKGEYRLAQTHKDIEIFNPVLKKGEVIFYHSKTLHSEDVVNSDITRLNLEFRIKST